MSIFEPSPSPWAGRVLSIFRIVAGLIFVSAGTMKLFDYPPSGMPDMPVPVMSLYGFAGLLEVVGGLLIVFGLFARPVAFVLSGQMAVAYFVGHAQQAFFPTQNQGIPAILYCFFFLYMVFAGPGPWSVDAMIARSRSSRSGPPATRTA